MRIEVVLPGAHRPVVRALEVPSGCSVAQALRLCGFRPDASGCCGFGVFGEEVSADAVLREGDRLEVCAPLRQTPDAARRRRLARRV